MPTFRYTPLAGAGPSATIEAPDRPAAVRALLARGVTPATIEPVSVPAPAGPARVSRAGGARPRGVRMSRSDLAQLVRELSIAVSAGLPVVQALRTLARQGRSRQHRAMLSGLIERVEHGASLADAASATGRPFDDMLIGLFRAGEASGRLPTVLRQAAELLDRDVRLRRSVLSATVYPMILLVLVGIAIAVVTTVVIPGVLAPLEGQAITLPWPTRVVQAVAATARAWWPALAALPVLLAVGIRWARTVPAVRLAMDLALLRVPLLGRLLRDAAVARFTRTLATLTGAGLPVLQSLRIGRDTLGNRALERVIDGVCDGVAAGRAISDPLERSGQFPPLLVQIVGVGERTGRLPETLAQAAVALEERTETTIKMVTAALPPLLIVVLAGIVGFVVAAVLLPLLEMQEALG